MSLGVAYAFGALLLAAELSIGVAPYSLLGLDTRRGEELRQAAQQRLEEQPRDRQILSSAAIDEAIRALGLEGEALHDCLRDEACAAGIAQRAGVDELLVGSAGGLGNTYVLNLALVRSEGVIARELQQSVTGEDALVDVVEAQIDQLLPIHRPWYRRWWVWTIAASVLVGAGVLTTLLLWPDEPNRDTYPLP